MLNIKTFCDFDLIQFTRQGHPWLSVVWPWVGGRASALVEANLEEDLLAVILEREPDEVIEAANGEVWSYRL